MATGRVGGQGVSLQTINYSLAVCTCTCIYILYILSKSRVGAGGFSLAFKAAVSTR